jgi:lipopolysaccharide/colanic/teichoic acid biosynthesis glycosyltransferase
MSGDSHKRQFYRIHGKRWLDASLATAALILLSPVLAAVWVSVRIKLGSPVLFRQPRPGRHGAPFTLLKFRTMSDARDRNGVPLPDGHRLTGFGRFLRSTSLDELPELWNVVRGEMSLVGPRPLLTHYLSLYTPEQARRHEIRPGLTGWSQVNGRNALSWSDRLEMDVWYVDHHSLALDLGILARTMPRVFRREGISAAGSPTMTEFTGSSGVEGLST